MQNRLTGKWVLITGATAGIGKATAELFAESGCKLIINGRRKERLQTNKDELKSRYDITVEIASFDVSKREACRSFVEQLSHPIDILINNAGLARGVDAVYDANLDDWDTMIDTNVRGLLTMTRLIAPQMKERNSGHIINIGSIAGHESYPGGSVYCSTKHAVKAFTEATKKDLHGTDVRVSMVSPGLVETEFSEVRFKGDQDRADEVYEDIEPLVAHDIGEIVHFIANGHPTSILWIPLYFRLHSLPQQWFIAIMTNIKYLFFALLIVSLMVSCTPDDSNRLNFEPQGRQVPSFNADSAYYFIEQQVNFGPRNPGSEGHQQTEEYLLQKLRSYAGNRNVFPQHFTAAGYEGDTLNLTNVIAAFNSQSSDRIMLCAHWDTRPRADKDAKNTSTPILGADDGGSGVGVLLELARIFQDNPPPIGVDIVLFDGEDYGREGDMSKYFLGSRYWSNNPPVQGYSPRFGILLDMVGGETARFPKEGNSMRYAPALVNEIWSIANENGGNSRFLQKKGGNISDDHVVINQTLGIPTINIIRHNTDPETHQFAPYWHTQNDDMSVIGKNTLQEVGNVLTELIYNRLEKSN
ncbi:MAG: SDR family NAD(P)-dependent oxidoreductase [Fodinibius sp.]|nr:SDR family NAD(P)-dependent oxidoreductase [Fodinibius sp.]